METIWGIDLGGTKIEGVVSPRDNVCTPLARLRLETEADRGYPHVLNRIELLVNQLKSQTRLTPGAIGFGTPGVLDPQALTMKNSAAACLNGAPLVADLTNRLGVPVKTANDANCFALAENLYGAARGAKVCFGVIMGTGVGGGIVIEGRALYGCQGIAGEWGHNPLIEGGAQCYCGKRGCVETVLSGPALQRFYFELSGQRRSLPEIVAFADKSGDLAALATIERACDYFGRALAVVINILDPEVVVLGGGVSNIPQLYSKGVKGLRPYVFNNRLETRIVQNQLGDSAGVFGAALLVQDYE